MDTFTLTQLTSQQYWTKLTDHSPLLVAPPPGSKISGLPFPMCLHKLSSWLFFLNQPFNDGTSSLITKGKQ